MSKQVAVILSGCGRMDGSEVSETILTLLALDKAGQAYQCFAPNILQPSVVNHYSGEVMPNERRNILVEAARIPHAPVRDLAEGQPLDYSALIFPGGAGAAKNLSTFAQQAAQATILPEVRLWIEAMIQAQRPVGFICIAPTLIPLVYPAGVTLTLGKDPAIHAVASAMGAAAQVCTAKEIAVDSRYRVVSTPAYMVTESVAEAAVGIEKLVQQLLQWIK